MEKKRNVRAILNITEDSAVEELIGEIQSEYVRSGAFNKVLAEMLTSGEMEDVFYDNIKCFIRKSTLKLVDDDTKRKVAEIGLTDFSVDALSLFISDIAEAFKDVSEEYSELFDTLEKAGFNYSEEGYILPELMLIEKIILDPDNRDDIDRAIDAIMTTANFYTNTRRTSKSIIACFAEDNAVREAMKERYFLTVGNSELMLYIMDVEDADFCEFTPCTISEMG